MKLLKKYGEGNILLFIGSVLLLLVGCAKEYSIEGLVNAPVDTLPPPVVTNVFPPCPLCNSSSGTASSSWSFLIGNSLLCGEIDTAIVNPARNAFTFFGPSTCSNDTGMVISVYLISDTLNKDIQNLTISRNAFYFYDRVTPSDIYVSRQNSPFTVRIEKYDHLTKIANGSFEGNVFGINGGGTRVTNGKFNVKLL